LNEVILLLLGIVGIFSIACSIALVALGRMIDKYPMGEDIVREKSIASPEETTKLSVIFFWLFFIVGAWAVMQDRTIFIVAGITTLFAICLFMATALLFSFAVLSVMKRQAKAFGEHVIQAGIKDNIPAFVQPVPVDKRVMNKVHYKRPASNFLIPDLLKKN
jgi:hypothetical protein